VLFRSEDGKFAEATYENCLNGNYPMARFLFVYINKKPGAAADTLVSEFIKFVASKKGQEIVVKDGYFPVPLEIATEAVSAVK
jgi:phosphate transport system substrate-binding protein